jgi:hypothetical protein
MHGRIRMDDDLARAVVLSVSTSVNPPAPTKVNFPISAPFAPSADPVNRKPQPSVRVADTERTLRFLANAKPTTNNLICFFIRRRAVR